MAPDFKKRETAAVTRFFDSVGSLQGRGADLAHEVKHNGELKVPAVLDSVLGHVDEKFHGTVLDSVLKGREIYKREHGMEAPGDLVETSLFAGYAGGLPEESVLRLDSASSSHHDQLSLQPNRAITAILSSYIEAMPFAAYLPTDIASNEARLAIVTHHAKSNFGEYADGSALDGIAGGGMYLDSERLVELSTNGGGKTEALATTITARFTGLVPNAVSGANIAVPLLRGRTVILVNGLPVARETETTRGTGNNTVSGRVTIAGTEYGIGGVVNSDTGALSITTDTDLPPNTTVHALVYIDYERAPDLAPVVGVEADVYKLYARSARGAMEISIDSRTQISNELSVDPDSEALLALRNQYGQERFYRSLQKLKLVGVARGTSVDFDFSGQKEQKTRAQMWLDFASVLGKLSQKMAEDTNDHGITHLFVTGFLSSQFRALPADIWTPSGIEERPGIYRMGRLFGKYDVYYSPKVVAESPSGGTSEILAIGRSTQTARNPIVVGDAVPPMFLELKTDKRFVFGQGFYSRGFSDLNPHQPSACAAVVITVTNLI